MNYGNGYNPRPQFNQTPNTNPLFGGGNFGGNTTFGGTGFNPNPQPSGFNGGFNPTPSTGFQSANTLTPNIGNTFNQPPQGSFNTGSNPPGSFWQNSTNPTPNLFNNSFSTTPQNTGGMFGNNGGGGFNTKPSFTNSVFPSSNTNTFNQPNQTSTFGTNAQGGNGFPSTNPGFSTGFNSGQTGMSTNTTTPFGGNFANTGFKQGGFTSENKGTYGIKAGRTTENNCNTNHILVADMLRNVPKCIEELRIEDYINRKEGRCTFGKNNAMYNPTPTTSGFPGLSQNTNTTNTWQSPNTLNATFGQNGGFGAQSNTPSNFGGMQTQSNTMNGFNQSQAPSIFGGNNPLGSTNPQPNQLFGGNNGFNTNQSSITGNPLLGQGPSQFGNTANTNTMGAMGNTLNLFGQNSNTQGPSLLSSNTNTSNVLFPQTGTAPAITLNTGAQNALFQKTSFSTFPNNTTSNQTTSLFPSQSTFSGTNPTQPTSLFGNLGNSMSNTNALSTSLFNKTLTPTPPNTGLIPVNNSIGDNKSSVTQHQNISVDSNDPFSIKDLLSNENRVANPYKDKILGGYSNSKMDHYYRTKMKDLEFMNTLKSSEAKPRDELFSESSFLVEQNRVGQLLQISPNPSSNSFASEMKKRTEALLSGNIPSVSNSVKKIDENSYQFYVRVHIEGAQQDTEIVKLKSYSIIKEIKDQIIQSYKNKNRDKDVLKKVYEGRLFLSNRILDEFETVETSSIPQGSTLMLIVPPKQAECPAEPRKSQIMVQSSRKENRNAPILTNGKYITHPTLEQLKYMSDEELQKVSKFTVNNEFGSIEFSEPVDLTSVNLDEIIIIAAGEIMVYPDDYPNKPAPGNQLNKPAEITLFNCIPEKDISQESFVETLKTTCASQQAEFISYESNVWKFKVNHFTRYGLEQGSRDSSSKKNDKFEDSQPQAFEEAKDDNAESMAQEVIIQENDLNDNIKGDQQVGEGELNDISLKQNNSLYDDSYKSKYFSKLKRTLIQKSCWKMMEHTLICGYKNSERSSIGQVISFPLFSINYYTNPYKSEGKSEVSSAINLPIIPPELGDKLKRAAQAHYQDVFTQIFKSVFNLPLSERFNKLSISKGAPIISEIAPLPTELKYKKILLDAIAAIKISEQYADIGDEDFPIIMMRNALKLCLVLFSPFEKPLKSQTEQIQRSLRLIGWLRESTTALYPKQSTESTMSSLNSANFSTAAGHELKENHIRTSISIYSSAFNMRYQDQCQSKMVDTSLYSDQPIRSNLTGQSDPFTQTNWMNAFLAIFNSKLGPTANIKDVYNMFEEERLKALQDNKAFPHPSIYNSGKEIGDKLDILEICYLLIRYYCTGELFIHTKGYSLEKLDMGLQWLVYISVYQLQGLKVNYREFIKYTTLCADMLEGNAMPIQAIYCLLLASNVYKCAVFPAMIIEKVERVWQYEERDEVLSEYRKILPNSYIALCNAKKELTRKNYIEAATFYANGEYYEEAFKV